jgi:hypothetical protein
MAPPGLKGIGMKSRHRSLSAAAVLVVSGAATLASVSSAAAATTTLPAPSASCPAPVFSQPFASIGDQNSYSLVTGQTPDNFSGAGWTLTNGARIVASTLADGTTGSVLDLPSGATAVSPVICVTSAYPVARMEIRDLAGAEGVSFNVEYLGTATASNPKNTGQAHSNAGASWDASDQVNIQPSGNAAGWQLMRIVLIGKGHTSNFELYNLYIDPRCSH